MAVNTSLFVFLQRVLHWWTLQRATHDLSLYILWPFLTINCAIPPVFKNISRRVGSLGWTSSAARRHSIRFFLGHDNTPVLNVKESLMSLMMRRWEALSPEDSIPIANYTTARNPSIVYTLPYYCLWRGFEVNIRTILTFTTNPRDQNILRPQIPPIYWRRIPHNRIHADGSCDFGNIKAQRFGSF